MPGARFYEDCYADDGDAATAERFRRWRELGAVGKADHIERLLGARTPQTVAEVGCGDGAVLAELGRRGIGGRRIGLEISSSALKRASQRPEIDEVLLFDGDRLPAGDGEWDFVYATHVLEHVGYPGPLVAELARVSRTVAIEVPLEANLAARRPAARAAGAAAGHIQRFDRTAVRTLTENAGLTIERELLDPLPRAIHTFWAADSAGRVRGNAKWAVRSTLALAAPLATRLMTMHYALIATRP